MNFRIRRYDSTSSSIPRCGGRVYGILPVEHKEIGYPILFRIQGANDSTSADTITYPYIQARGSTIHIDQTICSLYESHPAKSSEGSGRDDCTGAYSYQ